MTMIEHRPDSASVGGSADAAIVFPDGLVGCPDWKRFTLLVDDEEDLPVALLKSVEFPEVELLVTDPTLLDADYARSVGAHDGALYVTLTVQQDGWITANLLGPIVIDPHTRQGRQIVLTESQYSARHPVARKTGEG
jgi:flagellar assembly factor FliW